MAVQPCLLVVDPPVECGISNRKLVLESAHFNVIATYSCDEALETLERFPRLHAVILNAAMQQEDCLALLLTVRERYPEVLRVVVGKPEGAAIEAAEAANYSVNSYSPKSLLVTLQTAFPEITKHRRNSPGNCVD